MITPQDIDDLDALQQKENDGRGIECVRHIIFYLRREDVNSAQTVRYHEGDKTIAHPDVEKKLCAMFGCRLHGVHGCKNWLCV
tara:strand:+ start:489 stop:737 length:249 start_codon:yes stop_codon:yes gene_type:complete